MTLRHIAILIAGTIASAKASASPIPLQTEGAFTDSIHHETTTLGKESGENLPEVVVTGTRHAADIRHLPMTVTIIDREQLTNQQLTSVLPTVMQQVPGLMLTSRGMLGYGVSNGAAGGINLRGIAGGSGGLLVLIDGHPQYSNIYGHPISDSYQTLMAERVEVLRGPASVLYGSNAMGGVINIMTRQSKADGSHTHLNLGAGSYGTVQSQISNQTRHGAFSSTIGMQYNRTDNHRPRMGFEQTSGYLKLGYDIDPHWNAYAETNLTRFVGSDPGTTEQPMFDRDQWITRGEATVAVENHYRHTSGALSVFTNFGNHRIDDGWYEGRNPNGDDHRDYYFRSKDVLTGISLYQTVNLFEGNRVTAGFDYQHSYGRAYNTSKLTNAVTNEGKPTYAKSHRNEVAGYVDIRQELTPWLTADVGLRLNHHSVAGTEWVPQVGLVARPVETGEVKAMVSKGFRNPTMKDLFLYAMANDSLQPERLWSYELSWRHRLGRLTYGANLYYIKGDNMIQVVNRKNVNTGEVENYGIELEATYQIDEHWSLNTNHSQLKMNKVWVSAAPKYKGYLGANYRDKRWNVIAGVQYLSGLGLDQTGDGKADLTSRDICLVSATINYTMSPHLALWLRGNNLLAQRYELNYGFPMPRATFMGGINLNF